MYHHADMDLFKHLIATNSSVDYIFISQFHSVSTQNSIQVKFERVSVNTSNAHCEK